MEVIFYCILLGNNSCVIFKQMCAGRIQGYLRFSKRLEWIIQLPFAVFAFGEKTLGFGTCWIFSTLLKLFVLAVILEGSCGKCIEDTLISIGLNIGRNGWTAFSGGMATDREPTVGYFLVSCEVIFKPFKRLFL